MAVVRIGDHDYVEHPCVDCGEDTLNDKRCRDCDIDYAFECQRCEHCGEWLYNEAIGEKMFGLPRNEHARMASCPWMAL